MKIKGAITVVQNEKVLLYSNARGALRIGASNIALSPKVLLNSDKIKLRKE